MAIYDGFVSLPDGDVPVILGVENEMITMSSNGTEIGAWRIEEVRIESLGSGAYGITAEEETLRFVPNDASRFTLGLDIAEPTPEAPDTPTEGDHGENGHPDDVAAPVEEGPPPQPVTRVLFYVLTTLTVFLGLWALVSMVLG